MMLSRCPGAANYSTTISVTDISFTDLHHLTFLTKFKFSELKMVYVFLKEEIKKSLPTEMSDGFSICHLDLIRLQVRTEKGQTEGREERWKERQKIQVTT